MFHSNLEKDALKAAFEEWFYGNGVKLKQAKLHTRKEDIQILVSKKGKILGIGHCAGVELIQELIENKVGTLVDKMLNERMLNVLSTKENVNLITLGFDEEKTGGLQALITPIEIAGERLGTLITE